MSSKIKCLLVAGLAFGDEGKGTMVDYLCRKHEAEWVVRYNGGRQASHQVVLPDGRSHIFAQFGSGTLIPGCRTYLSEYMLIEPYAMINEHEHLKSVGVQDGFDRILINPKCMIITPWQWKANRLREVFRGTARHGSCGMGVGETRGDGINGIYFEGRDIATVYGRNKLAEMKDYKLDQCAEFVVNKEADAIYQSMIAIDPNDVWEDYKEWYGRVRWGGSDEIFDLKPNTIVFEGAQGVLLDEKYGFGVHKTWSDCTFNNALSIIERSAAHETPEITKIGVVRSYYTRHGVGPFITENPKGIIGGINPWKSDHNITNDWQGGLRLGYFDSLAFQYALEAVGGVDEIAVTHIDALKQRNQWVYCDSYMNRNGRIFKRLSQDMMLDPDEYTGTLISTRSMINKISSLADAPIRYTSSGATYLDKTTLED